MVVNQQQSHAEATHKNEAMKYVTQGKAAGQGIRQSAEQNNKASEAAKADYVRAKQNSTVSVDNSGGGSGGFSGELIVKVSKDLEVALNKTNGLAVSVQSLA
jgi:hypothetical protein